MKPNDDLRPNDDLISRAALRSEMYEEAFMKDSDMQKWDGGCWIRYKLFERVLERQPPAQPEIIRCKDCKYHESEEPGIVYCPNIVGGWVSNDFFCRDGDERGDDDGI